MKKKKKISGALLSSLPSIRCIGIAGLKNEYADDDEEEEEEESRARRSL